MRRAKEIEIMKEYFDLGIEPMMDADERKEVKGQDDFLKQMKANLDKKSVFAIEFSTANQQGDLSVNYNGWKIVMLNADTINLGNGERTYNPSRRFFKLENEYYVVVKSINEVENTIYVSHAEATRILRASLSKKIREELKNRKQKKEKKKIVLPARISQINDEYGFLKLDIAGFNIIGIAHSRNLDYDRARYTNLSDYYNVGEEIDVNIYNIGNIDVKGENTLHVFLCSNTMMEEDAWAGIEKRIKKRDMVIVKCLKKTNASAFVGEIQGERVSVLAISHLLQKTGIEPEPGKYYRAVVNEVSESKHSLKVLVLSEFQKKLYFKKSGLTAREEAAFVKGMEECPKDFDEINKDVVEKIIKEQESEEIALV